MPESPEPNILTEIVKQLVRQEGVIMTLLADMKRGRAWGVCVAILCLLGTAGGIVVGTWWGYGRGVEEMQQVFMTRGPEDVRAWLDLMVANPDIQKKEKQCEAGDLAHVTLSNGEHLCQIPLILHPVGMRRGGQ